MKTQNNFFNLNLKSQNENYKKKIPFELSDYVLEKYFNETGARQGWGKINAAVLAVSGGGDSVALLWMFSKFFKGKIFVVHVNHGIRDKEADEDENFAAEISHKFGAEFFSEKINVNTQKLKGESIEAAARRLRREIICKTVQTKIKNSDSIFLGHNRDDLAETVLFNILRGSGLRGSVGMTESTKYKNLKFYRPLLGLRREFLREILKVRGISWREDSTNNDENYTRNFIRLNLIPLINQKINSSAAQHLAAFGEDMRKFRKLEENQGSALLEKSKESETPNLILSRKILKTFTPEQRALIIRTAGRNLDLKTLTRGRCEELSNLIAKNSNFIFQWCSGMTIKSDRDKIIFYDKRNEN